MYIPLIRPDPASDKRQLAYYQGSPIPGPENDPDGWKILDPFIMSGSILNHRQVEVTWKVCECHSAIVYFLTRRPLIARAGQTCKLEYQA